MLPGWPAIGRFEQAKTPFCLYIEVHTTTTPGRQGRKVFFKVLNRTPAALLGIDISSSSVKLLELSKRGGCYRVEQFASRSLPAGVVVHKNINKLEALGQEMLKLAALVKTRTRHAAVAVSGAAVITRRIELPAELSEWELESQISVEADQYIPYPLDEVAVDFERQEPLRHNPALVEVLLAACKKDHVDLRVDALRLGGLKAAVVDIEASAMERAFRLLCGQMDLRGEGVVAIMDIGASLTTVYVLSNGASIYTREQAFGGARLAAAIQRRYGLEAAEAESALLSDALPPGYASEVLAPFREELLEQLTRALQFFFSSSQYKHVDLIVLAGGTACTHGLAAQMQAALVTPTVVANPFAKMRFGNKVDKTGAAKAAASLLVACGLALRSFPGE